MKPQAIGLAIALVASSLVFAGAASATHWDPDSKDAKGDEITYVGLGIGDHIISCPTASVTGDDLTVTVENPDTGAQEDQRTVPNPTSGVNVDPGICFGGALDVQTSTDAATADGFIPSEWEIWIDDAVYNANGNDDVMVAAFATIQAEITQDKKASISQTCAGATGHTDVCVNTPSSTVTKVKRLAQFSVCGQGGTDVATSDETWFSSSAKANDVEYELAKSVFVDGPLFFAFDCLGGGPVEENYNNVRDEVHNTPVCPNVACLFEFPAPGAECWTGPKANEADDHVAALPGTVGTIGWNEATKGCNEDANPGPVDTLQGAAQLDIKNFPVTVE